MKISEASLNSHWKRKKKRRFYTLIAEWWYRGPSIAKFYALEIARWWILKSLISVVLCTFLRYTVLQIIVDSTLMPYIFHICRYWCIPLQIESRWILILWPSKTQGMYFRHWSSREKYELYDSWYVARILAVKKLLTRTKIFKSSSFNVYMDWNTSNWCICSISYPKASHNINSTVSSK